MYILAALAGIGFAVAAVLHHRAFHSAANDLAFFDQIIWNSAHGRWFATSFVPYNFLGQHVQPVLLLYALLYRLWPSPELLLISQSLLAAAAAIPLFHVARRLIRHEVLAAIVAGAYLLSPYLHHAVNFDFHPETMSPFFAFLGYRFILDGRRRAAVCALLPLLLLKEDTVLLLLGIAWLCWLRRERLLGATLAGIAVGWGAVATLIIMPHFRSGPSDLEERYGYLGSGAADILLGLGTHPQRALAHLLTWGTALTLLGIIGSAGFLPLAAPAELLAAAPLLAFHLLSIHAPQAHLRLHYSVEVLPLIWIAAVCGLANEATKRSFPTRPFLSRGSPLIAHCFLILSAAIAFWTASPFPPARGFDPARFGTDRAHRQAVAEAIALIPSDASVSAQTGLGPHLAHRTALDEFPDGIGADYILLDARGDIARPYRVLYPPALAALPTEGYAPLWSRDGITLYRKG
ncbi:MAG: DUF2079 domain-containing protein [Chloroflexota bacterium]|nr:DUF2079 domain-containing protein [Chloroflexota bacterium]